MAPSGQDELEYLKSLAKRLQDRINDLEPKAKSPLPSTPAPTTPELRMILMGPPGAGQHPALLVSMSCVDELTHLLRVRQGHASPQDQGKVLRLPPRHGRHAPRAGCPEDPARRRGQEDYGRWW